MRTLMSALILACLIASGCNQPADKEKPAPKTPSEKPKKAPPSNGSGYRL
ncbi:MAG: hypothetical protein AB7K24_10445 [Gemmataceae bacterium]